MRRVINNIVIIKLNISIDNLNKLLIKININNFSDHLHQLEKLKILKNVYLLFYKFFLINFYSCFLKELSFLKFLDIILEII